jgi:transaldolase/glucose-6-phosphate isomerase
MRGHLDELRSFADEIRRLQFSQIVLLGMGGSSLSSELFKTTFRPKMGFPDLFVLDSTDPQAVKHTLDSITLSRALFVVSTKSGRTAETLAFYSFFRGQIERASGPKPGMQFIAITDPDTPLERFASEAGFRRTFLNSPAIGGRYSALSFFGLVPAALIGVDLKGLLDRAQAMVELCGNGAGPRDNPAIRLGAGLASLAKLGRDKVTIVLSEPIRALGPWIEQLLAGSLGKDGTGVVPVVDEPLGNPVVYGSDRAFVAITIAGDSSYDAAIEALDAAEHPVIQIVLKDALDIGGEFFRWEMAAATAGAVLGVNPFDEPDVVRAKENTAALLSVFRKTGRLPEWPVEVEEDGVGLMSRSSTPPASVGDGLAAFLAQAEADDYVAIQAYLPPTADTWARIQAVRILLRDRLRIATTAAFGPRYLHSTGQLHKGGRPGGLFIQILGEDKEDLPVPGADHGFSTLKAAQALADAQALRDAGRRVIRLRLSGRPAQALPQLLQIARAATRKL